MAMLRRLLTAVAVVASCLLIPATSALASGADVIRDCNDNGRLTKTYSQKEYRQALAQMPADIKQYTDCEGIIRRAQLGLPGSTGGPAANAGTPFAGATPEEQQAAQNDIAQAGQAGGAPQLVGGKGKGGFYVTPGALSFTKVSAATSELPTPLLVLLGLIVIATIAAAVHYGVGRFRERNPGA